MTSYERVRLAIDSLLGRSWHYVILDEGHKIKNPEAGITHAVKLVGAALLWCSLESRWLLLRDL